jgi:hypothetical protein
MHATFPTHLILHNVIILTVYLLQTVFLGRRFLHCYDGNHSSPETSLITRATRLHIPEAAFFFLIVLDEKYKLGSPSLFSLCWMHYT